MSLPKSEIKKYTYEDYLKYPEGTRIELIDGNIYYMAPAPSRIHQKISFKLASEIDRYISGNKGQCEVYLAPFDVRLIEEGETDENNRNTVQPDVSVICDKSKLDSRGCIGAPDFIIEVVSPSNASIDYVKKLYLYEKFRVREYWIVNPITESIFVYKLNKNNGYDEPKKYTFNDKVKISMFDELIIDFQQFS